jgi:3-oxoacyl-[acyl-carrier-protein] synthase II
MSHPAASGRVVVTGMGGLNPLGLNIETFWPALIAGKSGIGRLEGVPGIERFTTQIGGQIHGFNAVDWVGPKDGRRLDRFIAFAAAAASMALDSANFHPEGELAEQVGVLIGSGIGGLSTLTEQLRNLDSGGPGRVSPYLVPYMIPDMASGYVSIQHKLKGPNTSVISACSTGADAIGQAYHMIKRGDAVAMVCGGAEAPLNEIALAGFTAARAMSTRNDDPEHASRPWDKDRDGFVIAEGAGVLILEDYEFAKTRGANILAEVLGYGMSGDAHHITAPDPEGDGARRAMEMALRNAKVEPSQIGYINAHGTSTPLGDIVETVAVKKVFGADTKVPISSTKSMTGHTLGAAGALESIFSILAMINGVLPPTINHENPDPECDLDYIPNEAREAKLDYVLSNSFGFGGHNVSLIFGRV